MGTREALAKRIKGLGEIPTLPIFFTRLMEVIENERSSVKDLAQLIGKDPALSSKLLKLANSAYFGRFKKVCTAEQAVATVGFNEIKTICLSIGVFGCFSDRISNTCLTNFWIHALTTATAIRHIGSRGQESTIDKIYFGGLLHDIGKLALSQLFGDEYLAVAAAAQAQQTSALEEEKRLFGADHSTVGKWLAERWHFPNELGDLIAHHHEPLKPSLLRRRSLATVFLGDFIAHNHVAWEFDMFAGLDDTQRETVTMLGLTDAELFSIFQNVHAEEERIRKPFP